MTDNKATTVAQAKSQMLVLPEFKHWRRFAALIDGYQIAEELELDYRSWYKIQLQHWQTSQTWGLDVLHLRLMLFFAFRSDYMTGYTYTEHDEIVDSLLHALAHKLNLPYSGKHSDGK